MLPPARRASSHRGLAAACSLAGAVDRVLGLLAHDLLLEPAAEVARPGERRVLELERGQAGLRVEDAVHLPC